VHARPMPDAHPVTMAVLPKPWGSTWLGGMYGWSWAVPYNIVAGVRAHLVVGLRIWLLLESEGAAVRIETGH
jgi:hypothetical protein